MYTRSSFAKALTRLVAHFFPRFPHSSQRLFASDVRFLIDVGTINILCTFCRSQRVDAKNIGAFFLVQRGYIGKRNSFSAGDRTLMAR